MGIEPAILRHFPFFLSMSEFYLVFSFPYPLLCPSVDTLPVIPAPVCRPTPARPSTCSRSCKAPVKRSPVTLSMAIGPDAPTKVDSRMVLTRSSPAAAAGETSPSTCAHTLRRIHAR